MQTPEFFLLEQSDGKKLMKIDSRTIQFDTFQWAGDLITGSAKELALDYKAFLDKGVSEVVPPQFRVTIPGNGDTKNVVMGGVPEPPLFSVICPSIRPEFLPEAIESVINQKYSNWELRIGVDGPKETIRKKIEQVVEPYIRDQRIHVEYCKHMGTGPMRRFLSQKARRLYCRTG